ncbi:unnamed protein product [Pipistrellus nathusii]|uniref:Uncharacterized protein n=1 Tax=Pipistrellus nathusii TaxID=59473 RepID=A0ABN9ZXC2_PIPNA
MYFGSSPSYMKKESSQSPFWGFHFTGRKERKESQRRYKLGATGRRVRSIEKGREQKGFPFAIWVGGGRQGSGSNHDSVTQLCGLHSFCPTLLSLLVPSEQY